MKVFVLIDFLVESNILPVRLNTLSCFGDAGDRNFMILMGVANTRLIVIKIYNIIFNHVFGDNISSMGKKLTK